MGDCYMIQQSLTKKEKEELNNFPIVFKISGFIYCFI